MISKWKYNYTDEEKGMALTIQNKNQEIGKLLDELEEQERHIKEADFEIERLNNIIKRFEEDLREVYLTFGEFSEEYTEKKIRELKGDDKNGKS